MPPLKHRTSDLKPWFFLIFLNIIIVSYNCTTTFIVHFAYLPASLYERAYDAMTLEGAGAAILYQMFVFFPPRLTIVTVLGCVLGGTTGALSGTILTILLHSTKAGTTRLGASTGSLIGITLGTTILPLPQRISLSATAADFFDLYTLGNIETIQIGCQYGALPLALIHSTYLPILLLLTLLTITGTILHRIIAHVTNNKITKLSND